MQEIKTLFGKTSTVNQHSILYLNIIPTHIFLIYFTTKHTKTLILSFMHSDHHKQINKTVIGNMFRKILMCTKKWNKIRVWYNNINDICLSLFFIFYQTATCVSCMIFPGFFILIIIFVYVMTLYFSHIFFGVNIIHLLKWWLHLFRIIIQESMWHDRYWWSEDMAITDWTLV